MSFVHDHTERVVIHAMSIRMAKGLRELIQVCYREEEWADIDREFYVIIRANLEEFAEGQIRKRKDAVAAVHAKYREEET